MLPFQLYCNFYLFRKIFFTHKYVNLKCFKNFRTNYAILIIHSIISNSNKLRFSPGNILKSSQWLAFDHNLIWLLSEDASEDRHAKPAKIWCTKIVLF